MPDTLCKCGHTILEHHKESDCYRCHCPVFWPCAAVPKYSHTKDILPLVKKIDVSEAFVGFDATKDFDSFSFGKGFEAGTRRQRDADLKVMNKQTAAIQTQAKRIEELETAMKYVKIWK